MTLDEFGTAVSKASAYPLMAKREEADHFFAVLGKPPAMARYIFAVSKADLRDAIYPESIVSAHVEIANKDLDAAATGSTTWPVWGA